MILQLIIYYYVMLQLKVSAFILFPLLLARICLTERLACRWLRVRADGVSHFLSVSPLDSPFLLGHNRELHVVSSVCLASVFFCLLSLYSRTLVTTWDSASLNFSSVLLLVHSIIYTSVVPSTVVLYKKIWDLDIPFKQLFIKLKLTNLDVSNFLETEYCTFCT